MENGYVFKNDYRHNGRLRRGFNNLAKSIFSIDFEPWYQAGYWTERYVPYSVFDGERAAANVSASIMDFNENGYRKTYIQLGTVMTAESDRNKGLSRFLIEKVIDGCKEKADGFFLFANDSVLDFYPKFGFRRAHEYQYIKKVSGCGGMEAVKIPMNGENDWNILKRAINTCTDNSIFSLSDYPGMTMFYAITYMKDCVYYIASLNAYVIAEIEDGGLIIHAVYSKECVDMDDVVKAFGGNIKTVKLGFTPAWGDGFETYEYGENDTTLFVLGKDFDCFEEKKLMFPTLSHA